MRKTSTLALALAVTIFMFSTPQNSFASTKEIKSSETRRIEKRLAKQFRFSEFVAVVLAPKTQG